MSELGMENASENVTSINTQESTMRSGTVTSEMPTTTNAEGDEGRVLSSLTIANEMEKTLSAMSKQSMVSKVSALSKPSVACRICLMNEGMESLMTPCMCKGTTAFVHQQCLEHWLSRSGLSHCELCLFHFTTANHLRYGMWESMRIWFSHPSHRALLQADVLLCTLLSILTFGFVAVSMFGMYYLTTSHHSSGYGQVPRYWTETAVAVFLGIVLFAFILNTVVVIRANIAPWFRWWRRSREIQLVIRDRDSSVAV